jgi:hypothetical protein
VTPAQALDILRLYGPLVEVVSLADVLGPAYPGDGPAELGDDPAGLGGGSAGLGGGPGR